LSADLDIFEAVDGVAEEASKAHDTHSKANWFHGAKPDVRAEFDLTIQVTRKK
jgi:hypothetical protein